MDNKSIELLFRRLTQKVDCQLILEPLSPMSMVNDIPGSYYKSERVPTKYQLSGLFENLMGWHFGVKDRIAIWKEVQKYHKKEFKVELEKTASNSGFQPLVYHLFDQGLSVVPPLNSFDDLWKKAFRRSDALVHPNGTPNLDHSLIKTKRSLPRKEKKPQQPDDKAMEKLFKDNLDKFPLYYSTLATREYVYLLGGGTKELDLNTYKIKLSMEEGLCSQLITSLDDNSMGYLGTSDGWVEVKLMKI